MTPRKTSVPHARTAAKPPTITEPIATPEVETPTPINGSDVITQEAPAITEEAPVTEEAIESSAPEEKPAEEAAPTRGRLTFISGTKTTTSTHVPLTEIPADVIKDVEDAYRQLKANPGGRVRVVFPDINELNTYISQVVSYCAQRPEGAIRYRKSPTRGITKNIADFRIVDLEPDKK